MVWRPRVVVILTAPVAVVEYRGVQPAPQPHGNATHNTVAYVRVPATTMEAVGEEVLHANPKTVYNSQLLKEGRVWRTA